MSGWEEVGEEQQQQQQPPSRQYDRQSSSSRLLSWWRKVCVGKSELRELAEFASRWRRL